MNEELEHLNCKIDRSLGLGIGTATVDFIAQRVARDQSRDFRETLKSDLLQKSFEGERDAESMALRTFSMSSWEKRPLQVKEKLLANLAYPDMRVRETSVVRASETTFRWIFEREKRPDRPWASFCDWLEGPDKQLYWITGKPGSGKSTLMKIIAEPADDKPTAGPGSSPRYSSFLQRWAGDHSLVVASYYFWALGSPMQRSKEGMLRTLLHGLLSRAAPEVIATIMPESWEALDLFDEDPRPLTESSLQIFLSRAFQYMSPSTKICLFIDGLDEFEGQHDELALYLSAALETYPIKLCVSSRPWQVFEDAFHDKPSLRLQDLTFPDMVAYVRSKLYVGPGFALLQNLHPSFSEKLDENIALRADGVFLWLVLVVESLRRGIVAGDRIFDLQARLDQLPRDLEALFDRILDGLDPEYLDHAIQYFKLMEARREVGPPNVMIFSYADEDDELFGLTCAKTPLDIITYESRRDQLKRRLNSRCMGLLEITEPRSGDQNPIYHASQSRVHYLHRTFGDYMARDEVHERLGRLTRRGLHQSHDPHLCLCSSELAFSKLIARSLGTRWPQDIHHTSLSNFLHHAAEVQRPGFESMVRFVDEMRNFDPTEEDQTFPRSGPKINRDFGFESFEPSVGLVELDLRTYKRNEFITLVIDHGVVEYIRAKAQQRSPGQNPRFWHKGTAPLRRVWRHSTLAADAWLDLEWQLIQAVLSPSNSPTLVAALLESGADTGYKEPVENLRVWELALMVYMHVWHEETQRKEKREQIMALMIKYGAPIDWKTISRVYQELIRRQRPKQSHTQVRDDTFCRNIEDKLKSIKQGLK